MYVLRESPVDDEKIFPQIINYASRSITIVGKGKNSSKLHLRSLLYIPLLSYWSASKLIVEVALLIHDTLMVRYD